MRTKFIAWYFFLACAALLLFTSCNLLSPPKTRTPFSKNILLIGNSYTDFNGGLDKQLEGLYPDSTITRIAPGGYALENHWNGDALRTIRKGGWNYVVLQEQSQMPVTDQSKFYEFAGRFDAEIRKSGATTILLMTWERPDSVRYGVTTANLAASYNYLGTQLGVKVAPAGLAFARSLRARPDLALYNPDGHPTTYGTYLAACVIYATIFNTSPVGNPYSDASIPPTTRMFFQQVAAETLGY